MTGKTQTLRERKLKKAVFMGTMMGPAIIGFLVFYVYINFNSLVMAFQEPHFDTVTNTTSYTIGFDNFARFFREVCTPGSLLAESVLNTSLFFLLGYVNMLSSLVVAYFVYKKIVGYKFFRFVYYVPCIIMGTATASLFYYITRSSGPVGSFVTDIHNTVTGASGPYRLWRLDETANMMLAVYFLFYGVGGNMILFLGSMSNISPEIFEAARLDGVGWIREIFQLIIPLIWPTFSVMFLQSIVGITQASGPVYLFTKGENHTYTINYWLYANLLDGNAEREYSSAIGWLCTAFTFPIALVVRHVLDKIDDKIGV